MCDPKISGGQCLLFFYSMYFWKILNCDYRVTFMGFVYDRQFWIYNDVFLRSPEMSFVFYACGHYESVVIEFVYVCIEFVLNLEKTSLTTCIVRTTAVCTKQFLNKSVVGYLRVIKRLCVGKTRVTIFERCVTTCFALFASFWRNTKFP